MTIGPKVSQDNGFGVTQQPLVRPTYKTASPPTAGNNWFGGATGEGMVE